jgi:hypothetical protein
LSEYQVDLLVAVRDRAAGVQFAEQAREEAVHDLRAAPEHPVRMPPLGTPFLGCAASDSESRSTIVTCR